MHADLSFLNLGIFQLTNLKTHYYEWLFQAELEIF